MTHASPTHLIVDDSRGGTHFLEKLEEKLGPDHGYAITRTDFHAACNVLVVGDALFVAAGTADRDEIKSLARDAGGLELVEV